MSDVTAFVTRDSRRESRTPTRPDPTLTDPAHLQLLPGETSHHGVQSVTRESAPVAPVAPSDDMMLGTSTIEGIDLDAEVPCQIDCGDYYCPSQKHAADYIVRSGECPGCGDSCGLGGVCEQAWTAMASDAMECQLCGYVGPRDEVFWIVRVLR